MRSLGIALTGLIVIAASVLAPASALAVSLGPTITSLDVTAGPAFGVTQVTLTGTNLETPTGLTVGGLAASIIGVQGSTSVTFLTPPRAAGAADVVVTTEFGSATKAGAFTYVEAPEATPSTASVAYGSSGNPIPLNLSGGAPTSLMITSPASNGTVTVNGTSITYTPNPTFSGFDNFGYVATNVGGMSSVAAVTVAVAGPPLAPTLRASFIPPTVEPGGAANLVLTLTNPGSNAMTEAAARTALPTGLQFTGSPTSTCSGTTTLQGADTAVMQNISLAANANCVMIVRVQTADAGAYTVTPGGAAAPSGKSGGTAVTGVAGAGATLTVAFAAPVAKNVQAVSPFGAPAIINADTTGVSFGGATVTQPAHGTVTLLGGYQFMYTPTFGYFGVDSFTYTVTGPGGTSAPGTVSITITTPPAPTAADRSGVTVAYGTPALIDLSASITGIRTSVGVATAPSHGAISVSGAVLTYTPQAGYFGPDSFTYAVTGPGGTSAPATVSLTVARPPAPSAQNRSGISASFNSSGVAINLAGNITGFHDSIAIATAAQHGSTSIVGDIVAYTPASGYYGADSFTYTATGPGGTSAPATVSLTVATPAAPTVAGRPGVGVAYNSPGQAIDLATSVTGVHSAITISTAPAHGAVSVAGDIVTYTPQAGYFGSDSFSYTAIGPGGSSAPATVSLTVASPVAPIAAARSGVVAPFGSSGVAIDLSNSVSGVHTTLTIAAAASHGTLTVAGDVVTYTPVAGYFGADSFTYTATGPGGTSAPATVSLTVTTPPPPTAANKAGVQVGYGPAGATIDLSSSVAGVHTGLTLASQPAHGSATVAGYTVTYVPAAGYYGEDSLTYTATGPGGVSAPATVGLSVATPPAPTASQANVEVAHGMARTIDLSPLLTGVRTSVAIASAPQHGAVTVNGLVATYTPAAGYAGADSFTYTATGPGGTSAPAKVSLTVGAAPEASAKSLTIKVDPSASGSNSAGPVQINLADAVRNAVGIEIVRAPGHGLLTIVGLNVTYTPDPGFYGTDSFTYRALGQGVGGAVVSADGGASPAAVAPTGPVSAEATVTIQIVAPPITAPSLAANTLQGRAVAVNLTNTAQGGPFTAATIVTSTAAHGSAVIERDGQAFVLRFTPKGDFSGLTKLTYTLSNANGTSLPGEVAITVQARPNPLADAAVMALASAEIEDARRFGSTQIDIFGRRMERLHADDAGSGNTIALAMNGAMRLPLGKLKASEGAWKLWADGTINVGTFSPNAVEFDLSTDGLTVGADRKLGKDLAIGFGLGFSQGDHEAGSAKLETENYLAAAYGSWRPKAGLFVDGLLGVGKIAHDVERKAAAGGATLSGARDGDLVLASLTFGLDRAYGDWRFSYYGRASLLDGDLDAYVETGDPIYALAFETQSLSSATLALGTKIERRYDLAKGSFVPRLRLEYQQELKGAGSVQARYADWAASPLYSEVLIGAGRNQFLVGFGGDLDIEGRRFNFDYSVRTDTDRATDQRLTVGAQFSF